MMFSLKCFGVDFFALGLYPTGSNYICNPPVEDTDKDFLILCEDSYTLIKTLLQNGWESCIDEDNIEETEFYKEEQEYGVKWTAYRKGTFNLMITEDNNWYFASVVATEYCRTFNIQDKEQRIRIFRFLKYKEPLQEGDIPNRIFPTIPTQPDSPEKVEEEA